MFDIEWKIDFSQAGNLNQLTRDIRAAELAAARDVARTITIPAMRGALSFQGPKAPVGMLGTRTGRTRAQIKAKFWVERHSGLVNGSIKVRGDRAHIARFGETGTRHQLARKMFELVGRALRPTMERAFVQSFERHMKAKGYA
jgi:HK97 gp10 family phage protein